MPKAKKEETAEVTEAADTAEDAQTPKKKAKETAAPKTKLAETAKPAKKAGPKAKRNKDETTESDEAKKPKSPGLKQVQKRRSRLERRGKNYRKVHELIERTREYELSEAVALIPQTSFTKFDAAVEIHVNLSIDPKQADQTVRGTIALPHGTGKTQRVAVFAEGADQQKAKAAGADIVGDEDLLEKIKKEVFDFDILVSTPALMAKLGQYAKILGPKGLMPNPKSGTVTSDLAKTVKELKAGRLEFRNDPAGIVHQIVGRVSFTPEQLSENIREFLKSLQQAKPSGVKGTYIEKIWLTTSMGPSVKLMTSQTLASL